jgi:hypothetical protein
MPAKSNSALRSSKIPRVRELCESLGFGKATVTEEQVFIDATDKWRRSYIHGGRQIGADFLAWKKPDVQEILDQMARQFILQDNNGAKFWSTTRPWRHGSDLHFPDHTNR